MFSRVLINRLFAVILSLTIVTALMPAAAFADERSSDQNAGLIPDGKDEPELFDGCIMTAPAGTVDLEEELPANEELLELYIEEAFNTSDTIEAKKAGSRLTGYDAAVYKKLAAVIADIASGAVTSTCIEVTTEDLGVADAVWTAGDLGVDAIVTDNQVNQAAVDALYDRLSINYSRVLSCLLADCPYEFYWFDKSFEGNLPDGTPVQAVSVSWPQIVLDRYDSAFVLRFSTGVTISFVVASEYQNGSFYEMNPETGQKIAEAKANADAIVARYETVSDYGKLLGYKKEICGLVSYNSEISPDDHTTINPWQMIWVFDGDPQTNVVCEGYAKAFQYLCDSTATFTGGITCISVSGRMSGGTGSGPHMWNIVTMEDGKNYLADLTNCDEGTVGEPDLLFLAGTEEGDRESGYTFRCRGNNQVMYGYDSDTKSIFDQELILASQNYVPGEPVHVHSWDEGVVTAEPTCTEVGVKTFTCTECHQTWTEELDALGHDWDEGEVTLEPADGKPGIKTYTCKVCEAAKTEEIPAILKEGVERIYGSNRYKTSQTIADKLKEVMGVSQFQNIVLATGQNYPDALAGGYLASLKEAPIIMINEKKAGEVNDYIKANLISGGTIYVLGGTDAIADAWIRPLKPGFTVKRLDGSDIWKKLGTQPPKKLNRYLTNLAILMEAGVEAGDDILVATGTEFADALSASAVPMPILLVDMNKKVLREEQIACLNTLKGSNFHILGKTDAVSADFEAALKAYGGKVDRIAGENRRETSTAVAEAFFDSPKGAALAYAWNFPDGLCGGPLAIKLGMPLILTQHDKTGEAKSYVSNQGIRAGIVFGGERTGDKPPKELVNNAAVKTIMGSNTIITECR